jgi:hypothetical protein
MLKIIITIKCNKIIDKTTSIKINHRILMNNHNHFHHLFLAAVTHQVLAIQDDLNINI